MFNTRNFSTHIYLIFNVTDTQETCVSLLECLFDVKKRILFM